ncbi:MAG TPA: DUF2764 family protein [Candidatus Omnitrophica bacterium]|jgi:hypothetical protein|nr:DUF2764 family protein [Candidatus Omnitrophota bacterium]
MTQYYYLIASLPVLEFAAKAPFSYEEFLSRCDGQLSPEDREAVDRAVTMLRHDAAEKYRAVAEWDAFETSLKNEIARVRAEKYSKDPFKYIRGEHYYDPFTAGLAQWAVNQDSPMEAELFLDRARWEKLEEIKNGHYFDIDYLIAYAIQLRILIRWGRINSEGGMQVLADMADKENK